MVNLQESLKKLKNEEFLEIKRIRKENELKLKLLREDLSQQNREKKLKIKKDLEISKRKIDRFWEMKQKQFMDHHLFEIYEQEAITKLKENEMTELEKKEINLLKKLDRTQNVHNDLCEKLENALILSSQEFNKIYERDGRKPEEKLKTEI